MQTYSDQVKMLYREYAVALGGWRTEKQILERKVRELPHTPVKQNAPLLLSPCGCAHHRAMLI